MVKQRVNLRDECGQVSMTTAAIVVQVRRGDWLQHRLAGTIIGVQIKVLADELVTLGSRVGGNTGVHLPYLRQAHESCTFIHVDIWYSVDKLPRGVCVIERASPKGVVELFWSTLSGGTLALLLPGRIELAADSGQKTICFEEARKCA